MTNIIEKLLPCAHCGSSNVLYRADADHSDAWYFLECQRCGLRTDVYSTKGKACAAWNCRVEDTKSTTKIPTGEVVWLGHKNHFCLSDRCAYSLATYLPNQKILVSTVGELVSEPGKWEPLSGAAVDGGTFYETMVFRCTGELAPCGCGCPIKESHNEIVCKRYFTVQEANAGHLEMIQKYLI